MPAADTASAQRHELMRRAALAERAPTGPELNGDFPTKKLRVEASPSGSRERQLPGPATDAPHPVGNSHALTARDRARHPACAAHGLFGVAFLRRLRPGGPRRPVAPRAPVLPVGPRIPRGPVEPRDPFGPVVPARPPTPAFP
jgi:hypothetical protein